MSKQSLIGGAPITNVDTHTGCVRISMFANHLYAWPPYITYIYPIASVSLSLSLPNGDGLH
jgi:hypothetical protein